MWTKTKNNLRLDRKIKAITVYDRRASCKKLSMELAKQGIILDTKTINNRFLEEWLKAYRPTENETGKISMGCSA